MSSENRRQLPSHSSVDANEVHLSPQMSSFPNDSAASSSAQSFNGTPDSNAGSPNLPAASNGGSDTALPAVATPNPIGNSDTGPARPGQIQQNPLYYVRDQLFHALFQRLALAYARAVPPHARMALEWLALIKVSVFYIDCC